MIKTIKFFDRLEDRVRGRLSKKPVIYAMIGAVGIVLFWRGVWLIADETPYLSNPYVSLLVSAVALLISGLFVSFFVGDSILLSGITGEKKIVEKTASELKKETATLSDIRSQHDREELTLYGIQDELRQLRTLVEEVRNHQKK